MSFLNNLFGSPTKQELQILLREKEDETNRLLETLSSLRIQIQNLEETIGSHNKEIARYDLKYKNSLQKIVECKEQLARYESQIKNYQSEQRKIDGMVERIQVLEGEKKALGETLSDTILEKEKAEESAKQLHKALNDAEDRIVSLKQEALSSQSQTENADQAVRALQSKITLYERETASLRSLVAEKNKEIATLHEKADSLPTQKSHLTAVSSATSIDDDSPFFKGLNEKQKEAVSSTEGYIRVVAGAGSGKTKVLTNRYAYINKVLGISQENILCVTFTNKAANEMQSRIRRMIPGSGLGWIGTFHGICYKILREDIYHLNYPKEFKIIDEDDQKAILSDVFERFNLKLKNFPYKRILGRISFYKTHSDYVPVLVSPDPTFDFHGLHPNDDMVDFVIREYLIAQRKNYYLDFNDCLCFVLYLLETNKEFKQKWASKFEYIEVDEFQDVSDNQFALVHHLSDIHHNLFIVGDPDQMIYSWRGADINLILNFDKRFPDVKTIILDTNYRSTPQILNSANSLIAKNKSRIDKNLISVKQQSTPVHYHHSKIRKDECIWIAEKINELHQNGVEYKDIAILFRANRDSLPVEQALIEKQIPYYILQGIAFFQRKELKDMVSYLRMAISDDDVAFLRTVSNPPRRIGKSKIKLLQEYSLKHNTTYYTALKQCFEQGLFVKTHADQYISTIEKAREMIADKNISELFDYLLKASGYEKMLMVEGDQERLDNLAELKIRIDEELKLEEGDLTIQEYLSRIALMSNADGKEKADSVKMMTIHTSKGMEFPYVFVCMLNEGFFPSAQAKTPPEMEEERRCAYVAFTRAKEALYLTDAEKHSLEGNMLAMSRFLFETDHLEMSGDMSDNYKEFSHNQIQMIDSIISSQEKTFEKLEIGSKIEHSTFGWGTITEASKKSFVMDFDGKKRTFTSLDPFKVEIKTDGEAPKPTQFD